MLFSDGLFAYFSIEIDCSPGVCGEQVLEVMPGRVQCQLPLVPLVPATRCATCRFAKVIETQTVCLHQLACPALLYVILHPHACGLTSAHAFVLPAPHHPEQVQRRKLERGDVPESGATALADVDAGMLLQVRGWSGWRWVWR